MSVGLDGEEKLSIPKFTTVKTNFHWIYRKFRTLRLLHNASVRVGGPHPSPLTPHSSPNSAQHPPPLSTHTMHNKWLFFLYRANKDTLRAEASTFHFPSHVDQDKQVQLSIITSRGAAANIPSIIFSQDKAGRCGQLLRDTSIEFRV